MKNTLKIVPFLGVLLLNTGCQTGTGPLFRQSMFEETAVTQRPIVIEEARYIEKQPHKDISYAYLMNLSDDYKHFAKSPLYIAMSYDPDSRSSEREVKNKSSVMKGQLAKLGVSSTIIKTIPIVNSQEEVVISYDRVTATGPKNCGAMPGYKAQTGNYGNYGIGCTVKGLIAQQVAYPKDLLGQSQMDKWDADRAGNAVTRDVRSGETSKFVPSYVLSELAGNTTE